MFNFAFCITAYFGESREENELKYLQIGLDMNINVIRSNIY